jgi:LPS-assembly protein
LQEFNQLGDNIDQVRGQQGAALPTIRFSHYEDLAEDMGRIEISGKLLGVRRQHDDTRTYGTFGFAGGKQHASVQAAWQKQWIGGGGFVATPYLGGRADFAYYDGTQPAAAGQTSLWSATPIAAMDVRFPISASDGSTVHLIEPIGQLVYRGSNTTAVGITNDDAQSFVFDDTNLFSYNRFSGSDRQETGLRANIGGRYQASFADGGYVELVAGQSFHIAGNNAFAATDPSKTGLGSGMDVDASYAVLGLYGSLTPGIGFGGKLQLDPNDPQITRAGLGASFARDGYSANLDYDFIAANDQLGQFIDQHEIGAEIGVPVAEYWTVRASTYWDIANSEWLQFGGGLTYDDGFVAIGAGATRTGPTHTSPNDTRITATFRLKAPAGFDAGYSGAVPVPGL